MKQVVENGEWRGRSGGEQRRKQNESQESKTFEI